MRKKISEMTAADKIAFLEGVKKTFEREHGIPWKVMEAKMLKEIEDTFDDKKFVKMDPDSLIDAAYARKEFGKKKPDLVDYMLWMVRFVRHTEYAEW